MTGWRNISLKRAEQYAAQFVQLIREACVGVEVAGEVRRRQGVTSSPIEVVAEPILIEEHDLFGASLPTTNVLVNVIGRLVATGRADERREQGRGKRKVPNEYPTRLLFRADSGMLCPVDVWVTTAQTFGAVLALRTGPYGLRNRLMTPRQSLSVSGASGMLPRGMRLDERRGLVDATTDEVLDTPTEEEFFRRIDVEMVPPEERR